MHASVGKLQHPGVCKGAGQRACNVASDSSGVGVSSLHLHETIGAEVDLLQVRLVHQVRFVNLVVAVVVVVVVDTATDKPESILVISA